MLFAVAGSKIFIGGPADGASLPWVEIGETEAVGALGIQWQTQETTIYDCDEMGTIEVDKTARAAASFQIVMAVDGSDPGQIRLWGAAASAEHYHFRLVLPSGASRSFAALVTALSEVFDSANTVIKLQADLMPSVASYQRSEVT